MDYSEKISVEGESVSCELRWKNPGKLKRKVVFETEEFRVRGISWKICLYRAFSIDNPEVEILGGFLARMDYMNRVPTFPYIVKNNGVLRNISPDYGLDCLELSERPIIWNELMDEENGLKTKKGVVLGIKFTLKSPSSLVVDQLRQILTVNEGRASWMNEGKTGIHVEVITDESINYRLQSSCPFGLVSSVKKRSSFVLPSAREIIELLRPWMRRYKKSAAYSCLMKGPNHFSVLKKVTFDDRSVQVTDKVSICRIGGELWAPIYLTSNPDLADDTIVCFAKLFDHETFEIRYVGPSLIKSKENTFELFSKAAVILPGEPFHVYLEKDKEEPDYPLSRIEGWKSTTENGLYSGCCVVVVPQQPEMETVSEHLYEFVRVDYRSNIEISYSDDNDSSSEDLSEEDNNLCVICMDRCKSVTLGHGRTAHKCVCSECAAVLERQRNPLCPICRQPVQIFIDNTF